MSRNVKGRKTVSVTLTLEEIAEVRRRAEAAERSVSEWLALQARRAMARKEAA